MKKFIFATFISFSIVALAQDINMPKAQWLQNLKPIMSNGLCATGSPLLKVYKGAVSGCPAEVESLFDKCTTKVPEVLLPETITSIPQANKYGSVIAECVSAHYMGGDALKAFLLLQEKSNATAGG